MVVVFVVLVYVVVCIVGGLILVLVLGRLLIMVLFFGVMLGLFVLVVVVVLFYGYYYCEWMSYCLVGVILYQLVVGFDLLGQVDEYLIIRVGVVIYYDVVVFGVGFGGYVVVICVVQFGLSIVIVEVKYWGGVCFNVGCILFKVLLCNVELVYIFIKDVKVFGISGEVIFDYGIVYDCS